MIPRPDTDSIRVLLVDDDEDEYVITRALLADEPGYRLDWAETPPAALSTIERGEHDVVLLDYHLGDGRNGLELLASLGEPDSRPPVIFLTGHEGEGIDRRALQAGASDYLQKAGLTSPLLTRSIRYALERSAHDRALRRSRKAATENLLSHVSHEFRTPLNAAYQFITILRDGLAGDLTEAQREYLDITERNARQLRSMIGDLMEVAREKDGRLRIEPRPGDLENLIADKLEALTPEAVARDLSLRHAIATDLPPVRMDARRIRQVLGNLVGNALKFTPAGGRVEVCAAPHENDPELVRVTVRDNGCGIAPEAHERIFERFHQERTGDRSAREGLGLGLFIARDLVERHGGSLRVESRPGEGATFAFTLPIA